jgi:deoxyribodipyrimidine photo-lyase
VNTHRNLQVVWFKRDLRIEDNAALAGAAARGPVLPLYMAEPELWRQPDVSARHWAFIAECLQELRDGLGALGVPLVIRSGDALDILDAIQKRHGIAALWSHEETGNGWTFARDKRVAAWCRANGIPWHQPRQNGVIRGLRVRGGWARAWDSFMALPVVETPPLSGTASFEPGAIPSARDLGLADDTCPERQPGGRRAGLARLNSFLDERGIDYRREMSSPLTGAESCSRLSPHLAFGTLSMREVAQAAFARMRALKSGAAPEARRWRASLTSFSGRLHWHCHFMQKLESEPRIEFENLHPAYDGLRPVIADRARLDAWAKGETGFPFVDACMRSLSATGWLNFRMRAMLMAFASYHLWLPWRDSGLHLARLFTDYEPGIHWPQTQMQSGTTGINTVRIYNPVKQGYDQDPDGVFVRRWLPELRDVPDRFVHEPWAWDGAAQLLGRTYPERIVEHLSAAKAASESIWGARRGAAFGEAARAIQEKHGSRKSGMRNAGRRAGSAGRKTAANQLSLDLAADLAEGREKP